MIFDLQFFGGRGASLGELSDGPTPGGGSGKTPFGQPNTPQVVPTAQLRGQIGAKGRPISSVEATKNVNPYYNPMYGDYSENCQRCVVAYELNRRGYKVEAEASYGDKDPYPRGRWRNTFKGLQMVNVGARNTAKTNENIKKNMSQWGNGSRAIVEISKRGGGHVFNVEYHNGKLYYYDAQVGKRYDPKRVFDNCTSSATRIARVDNLDIGHDAIGAVRKRTKKRE